MNEPRSQGGGAMSESCNRTCATCRLFTREPGSDVWGVCWKIKDGFDGFDRYLCVHKRSPACDKWESVSSGLVGGEVVFVSSCDRDALLDLADELKTVYCPDYGEFDRIVDRIREACGAGE